MARPEGSAHKPTEGFEDTPIHLRALDEDIQMQAIDKAMVGDASSLEALEGITWNHVYMREDKDALAKIDKENHRKSVQVIADVALSGVGESLREARKRVGYTQAEAAASVGISTQTLSRIERGVDRPSLVVLISLCWMYCTSVDRVLGQMTSDEERLLTTYRATIDVNRPRIIRMAESVQAAQDNQSNENATEAEAAFIDRLQKRSTLAWKLVSRAVERGESDPIDWASVW